jgi:hypothetical protein
VVGDLADPANTSQPTLAERQIYFQVAGFSRFTLMSEDSFDVSNMDRLLQVI